MTKFNFEKLNKDMLVKKRDEQNPCSDQPPQRIPSDKKRRTRGRNRPRPQTQRYRWKEAIFGKGYPDMCALKEGAYRPRQAKAKQSKADPGNDSST